MDKGIDASLGLEVALITLQRLRKHGILQAEVSHLPGIRERCRCSIEIVGGKIISCVVEDMAGKRYSIGIDAVVAADQKKGPFSWVFRPQIPPQSQRSLSGISQASPAMNAPNAPNQQQQQGQQQYSEAIRSNTVPVPLLRASDLYWPNNLPANSRVTLSWIFSLVDGQRTVAEITVMLPRLSFEDVKRGLHFLKQIGAIKLMG